MKTASHWLLAFDYAVIAVFAYYLIHQPEVTGGRLPPRWLSLVKTAVWPVTFAVWLMRSGKGIG